MIVVAACAGVVMAAMCVFGVVAPGVAFARGHDVPGQGVVLWAVATLFAALWASDAGGGFRFDALLNSLGNFLGPWPWAVVAAGFGVAAVNAVKRPDPELNG